MVAPFAGAWIETTFSLILVKRLIVAPFAGAWIETPRGTATGFGADVAPFAGAWIETSCRIRTELSSCRSHPSRVRGLKLKLVLSSQVYKERRTLRGCVD